MVCVASMEEDASTGDGTTLPAAGVVRVYAQPGTAPGREWVQLRQHAGTRPDQRYGTQYAIAGTGDGLVVAARGRGAPMGTSTGAPEGERHVYRIGVHGMARVTIDAVLQRKHDLCGLTVLHDRVVVLGNGFELDGASARVRVYHTAPARHVSTSAVANTTGPAGPTGPTGPAGPPGPATLCGRYVYQPVPLCLGILVFGALVFLVVSLVLRRRHRPAPVCPPCEISAHQSL